MSLARTLACSIDRIAGRFSKLPITPARESALRALFRRQFGVTVTEITLLTEGQAHASTPLLVTATTATGAQRRFFAKYLSAKNWCDQSLYRLYRHLAQPWLTEDEPIVPTLKMMVEFEHYMTMLFAARGLRVPEELGIFQVAEREFLCVSDFLAGSSPLISLARVSRAQVCDALRQITIARRHRLAHRDIKASNLLARGSDEIWFVDLGYAVTMASDRLLALDLANLLATLALRHDPAALCAQALDLLGPAPLAAARPLLARGLINRETFKTMDDTALPDLVATLDRTLADTPALAAL